MLIIVVIRDWLGTRFQALALGCVFKYFGAERKLALALNRCGSASLNLMLTLRLKIVAPSVPLVRDA